MTGGIPALLDLNDDVLLCILEELQPGRSLIPLSMTCRAARNLAKPFLFQSCRASVGHPFTINAFPPVSLWCFVQQLELHEVYPEATARAYIWERTHEPTACAYVGPEFLSHVLREMPLLGKIVIRSPSSYCHGLPWASLKAILASPHLRKLVIDTFLLCTLGTQEIDLDINVASPLASFTYWVDLGRGNPRSLPTERHALAILLGKLSCSLRKLMLPLEPVPLDVLQTSQWPKLRDLDLYGEISPLPTVSYGAALANMPELRVLTLTLLLPRGMSTPILWPSDTEMVCLWPNLESFEITHPHFEDQLYAHLPPTLVRLSLCSPPCHYDHLWGRCGVVGARLLHGPLLTASQTLQLLQTCRTPNLAELAIEFLEDDQEFNLYNFLPRAFPRLTSLSINVYRAAQNYSRTLVERIALALAQFSRLNTLRMYLGFEPIWSALRSFQPVPDDYVEPPNPADASLKKTRDLAAQTFANILGPSVQRIILFHPVVPDEWYWVEYRRASQQHVNGKDYVLGGDEYAITYAHGTLIAAPERGLG